MAVWQVKLNIATQQSLPLGWTSWEGYEHLCQKLNKLLTPSDSWHEELQSWGYQGKNQIDLWITKDECGEFSIRIDLRDDFDEFVTQISKLLQELNLKIEYEGELIDPTVGTIFSIIYSSNAFRFVKNPRQFIKMLSRRIFEDGE